MKSRESPELGEDEARRSGPRAVAAALLLAVVALSAALIFVAVLLDRACSGN